MNKKAKWVLEYDMHNDKCYKCPGCAECEAPVAKFGDGKYHCFSCGEVVDIDDEMAKWFAEREETKEEQRDCNFGCGGKGTMRIQYIKNPVTLEWQTAYGYCTKCGMKFIV